MYPLWSYFPRNEHAPPWVTDLVGVVAGVEAVISTETVPTGLSSDQVLQAIAPGLIDLGYAVESSKRRADKNFRPVLLGDNGRTEVSYEIDAFHDQLGIAVEVEAGRGAANNADYRDIVRTSLILDADYLALLMPIDTGQRRLCGHSRRRGVSSRRSTRRTDSNCRSRACS